MKYGLLAAIFAAMAAISPAWAQGTDLAAQVKVIETQPAGMDRAMWKDKRRDAARKLAQSKDKRAVPVLIRLAETETFDIIGEIAIEGLGNLGDSSAVPVLEKIAGDPQRDKIQRDLAKKALGKLGPASTTSGNASSSSPGATGGTSATGSTSGTGGNAGSTGTTGTAGTGTGGSEETKALVTHARDGATTGDLGGTSGRLLGGGTSSNALPELPDMADDALAAYERVTFAGGTANVGYDSARKRFDFDADIAGLYQKRVEREQVTWGLDAGAHVVAGYINPSGPALSRGLQLDATANGEARLYTGSLYGIGRAAGATQINYVSDIDPNNANNTLKDTRFTADLQVAVGGGYGRVLDVGAAIRVRRLVQTLDAAHALGKPIDAATRRRLQLTWWALRGERSTYRALVATVAILREAGVLLGEPDAGLSYELLNVLRDSQLFLRPSGFDANVVFSEGYLQRPSQPAGSEAGRIEQALASAAYGAQLDDDLLEISGGGYARLRLFAPDNQPSPWAIGTTARIRRFAYGDHGDPIGAIDLSGGIQLSDDDLMDSKISQRVTGELGFTWWINAASGFRLSANIAEDRGVLFLGAQLELTYGLLDGTFAR
jgi:hypothetical protein